VESIGDGFSARKRRKIARDAELSLAELCENDVRHRVERSVIIANHDRYRKVKLDIMLEVAFNSIQPNTRHANRLALRFPRIETVRRDKNVDSIDTLQYARDLAEQPANLPADFDQPRH